MPSSGYYSQEHQHLAPDAVVCLVIAWAPSGNAHALLPRRCQMLVEMRKQCHFPTYMAIIAGMHLLILSCCPRFSGMLCGLYLGLLPFQKLQADNAGRCCATMTRFLQTAHCLSLLLSILPHPPLGDAQSLISPLVACTWLVFYFMWDLHIKPHTALRNSSC